MSQGFIWWFNSNNGPCALREVTHQTLICWLAEILLDIYSATKKSPKKAKEIANYQDNEDVSANHCSTQYGAQALTQFHISASYKLTKKPFRRKAAKSETTQL